ncbi:hypothetical protein EYF80_042055 [Liparis tanakae]|uniref:Uncharacterized protein n=1 Tax=Liparis tanakae TaxID=230148 RepID=A0A4Z2G2F1_9TELE|nr:hypothetical protein EYF80_042055 [Liparis tanakae]
MARKRSTLMQKTLNGSVKTNTRSDSARLVMNMVVSLRIFIRKQNTKRAPQLVTRPRTKTTLYTTEYRLYLKESSMPQSSIPMREARAPTAGSKQVGAAARTKELPADRRPALPRQRNSAVRQTPAETQQQTVIHSPVTRPGDANERCHRVTLDPGVLKVD